MYQENRENINWIKIFLRIIIAFLVLILSIKLISIIIANQEYKKKTNSMEDNLKVLDNIAKDYFVDDNLPTKIGETKKVTLEYLIDKKMSNDIKDSNGNKCNYKESYIKITKLETEYQIQSFLICGNEKDYLNRFIEIKKEDIIIKPATTTTTTRTTKKITTSISTTKKKTTQAKKYKVSFNSNGGNYISHQLIRKGSKATSYTPYREGYVFVGWYYHGEKFDFNTKINQNYVLTAKWSKK